MLLYGEFCESQRAWKEGIDYIKTIFVSIFLPKERVSYVLSRFSEKERMTKKEEPEGISISPQTSSESKLTKRSLAQQGFLF